MKIRKETDFGGGPPSSWLLDETEVTRGVTSLLVAFYSKGAAAPV